MDRCALCKQAVQFFDDGMCFHCSPMFRFAAKQPSTDSPAGTKPHTSTTTPRPAMRRVPPDPQHRRSQPLLARHHPQSPKVRQPFRSLRAGLRRLSAVACSCHNSRSVKRSSGQVKQSTKHAPWRPDQPSRRSRPRSTARADTSAAARSSAASGVSDTATSAPSAPTL